jgi:hypothetical protein
MQLKIVYLPVRRIPDLVVLVFGRDLTKDAQLIPRHGELAGLGVGVSASTV